MYAITYSAGDPGRTIVSSLSLHFFICKIRVTTTTLQDWCGHNCTWLQKEQTSPSSPTYAATSVSTTMGLAMQSCLQETLMPGIPPKGSIINSTKLMTAWKRSASPVTLVLQRLLHSTSVYGAVRSAVNRFAARQGTSSTPDPPGCEPGLAAPNVKGNIKETGDEEHGCIRLLV